jgi:predicted O-methyltransferase YrrM
MTPFQIRVHEGKNMYEGFPAIEWQGTWWNDPGAQREIFQQCIERLNPSIIIEVGSFVGESAIHMAKIIKAQKRETAILCVDTFYAGFDHYKGAREKIRDHFGRSDLFYKFMGNVIQHGCQDVIVPFAIDSINGARVIKWLGLVPDYIYVDGSHEKGDVLRDYNAYWDLLPSGGGMLVDDVSDYFPGVVEDFTYFTSQNNLKPALTQGEKHLLIKP